MLTPHLDRRNFLKLGAGAAFSLGCACAYSTRLDSVITVPIPARRVMVCSDIHIGHTEDGYDGETWFQKALDDYMAVGSIDYACVLGDIAHNGMTGEFNKYRLIREESVIDTWYELAGNHEYFNNEIESYYSLVCPDPSYMVQDGNVVWFFLSDEVPGNEGNISEKVMVWFIEKLAQNQDKIIIVCTHQCVYDTVRDSTDSVRYIYPKEMIAEICDFFKIDLWLCGHQHYYPYSSSDMFYNGKTLFINVSSLNHSYGTGMSQSVILDFHEETQEILAYRRSHDIAQFESIFTVRIPLPFPLQMAPENDLKRTSCL